MKKKFTSSEVFDRIVDENGTKTKVSRETVRAFLIVVTYKINPEKVWFVEVTENTGDLKSLALPGEDTITLQ